MKKYIALLLTLVFCLTLCACGSKAEEYCGMWVREPAAGSPSSQYEGSLQLNADKTYLLEEIGSDGEVTKFEGTWKLKKDQIILTHTTLLEGEHVCFGPDGKLLKGMGVSRTYEIEHSALLRNGTTAWNKVFSGAFVPE